MTPEEHTQQIAADFSKEMTEKYMAGQKEHGGNLARKPVINFINEEALDQYVYLHVLRQQWERMTEIAKDGINRGYTVEAVEKIYNILIAGNEEGINERGD